MLPRQGEGEGTCGAAVLYPLFTSEDGNLKGSLSLYIRFDEKSGNFLN